MTINQIKELYDIYEMSLKCEPIYLEALKNTLKISFRKEAYKVQWFGLTEKEKEFIDIILSRGQKHSIKKIKKYLQQRRW